MTPGPYPSRQDLLGRIALVTGATGGLGLRVAEVLASRGAMVLIGSRSESRGAAALDRVASVATDASPELISLDLSDLGSVRAAASSVRMRTDDRLDLLVNNGGVMAPPLSFSADGYEMQWATNVIGPAALTWLLLPAIERGAVSRVVFVSSNRHSRGDFDEARLLADVRGENYRGFDYYGRTKLADLLLSRELDRYLRATGSAALSVAAHPGFTATGIVGSGFAALPAFAHRIATAATGVLGQSVEMGALPILHAATAPGVLGSQFFGPTGLFELRGQPGIARRSAASTSDELGGMLVRVLSQLTGIPAPGRTNRATGSIDQ
jgi:NAD(P)-dependent dehydrogenase (short-subunit alcohol dehydrogenase family)